MKRLSAKYNFIYRYSVLFWPLVIVIWSIVTGINTKNLGALYIGAIGLFVVAVMQWVFLPVKGLLKVALIHFDQDNMYVQVRGRRNVYKLSDVIYLTKVRGFVHNMYEIGTNDNRAHYFMADFCDVMLGDAYARETEKIDEFIKQVDQSKNQH